MTVIILKRDIKTNDNSLNLMCTLALCLAVKAMLLGKFIHMKY